MNEQDVRALVRAAVARHLASDPVPAAPPVASAQIASLISMHSAPLQSHASSVSQASHALFTGLVNVSGECVIEPAVQCDHCGYCKSQGY